MRSQACAVILLCVAAGCSDSPAPRPLPEDRPVAQPAAPFPVRPALGDSAQNTEDIVAPGVNPDSLTELNRFIVFGLARIGSTRDEIRARLGTPDSAGARAVENRHVPAQIDSIVTVYYPDVTVTSYRTQDGGELIMGATVRSNELLRLKSIEIGMPWPDVTARFGEPHSQDAGAYRYACSACVVDHEIIIHLHEDRVSAIGFTFYVD